MNIFYKTALESLKRNRARTLVTIAGVALSAAMFTGIAGFGTSLMQYLIRVETAKRGDWHVVFSDADADFLQRQIQNTETENMITYENLGYALLEGAGEASAEKPYLFFAGFREETFQELPLHLTAGRMPENGGEILIPSHIAVKAGVRIRIGDTLSVTAGERECSGKILTQCDPYAENEVLVNGREKSFVVTGIYERPGFELHGAPGYTVITRGDEGEQTERCSVYVKLQNPRKVKVYAENQEGGGSWSVNEELLRFLGVSDNRLFNLFLFTVGGVLTAMVMTASVFLIYNSFHISLGERVHQFGILMSVGATSRQLRGSVLFEGFCVGSLGIPLGILTGLCSIRLLLSAVSDNFGSISASGVPLEPAVSVPVLLACAAVSMAAILISAWIPARKAASLPVLECIRQTNEIRTESRDVRTPKLVWKVYGLEGALALKNFKRNKKRYRGVVLSLAFSVVLVITGSTFNTTLKQLTGRYAAEGADGDVSFVTADMSAEAFTRLYERLKAAEGVKRSTWQENFVYLAETEELPEDFLELYREAMGDGSTGPRQQIPLYTQFIEDEIYDEFMDGLGVPEEEYTGPDAKVLMCTADTAEHVTYCTGSSLDMTLLSSSKEPAKTVHGFFSDSYPLDMTFEGVPDWVFVMSVPMRMKEQFAGLDTVDGSVRRGMLFWTDTPAQTMAGMQNVIMEQGVAADYMMYNLAEAFELFRNISFVVDIFTYVFVGMIALIAVANVFNTISTNIRLRRRELAMLRSVGMSKRSFCRMMNFECVFYGVRTLQYGIPPACLLSWLIYRTLMSVEKVEDIPFAFPWGAAAVSVLGVFLIVFVTMVYASGRISRENIIDALRDEMA